MNPLSTEFLPFLQELNLNNNRDWFKQNKSRFEAVVKKPFEELIELVIARVTKLDTNTEQNVKNCVYRIYKDIRFSKDKTPYKTHMAAIVSPTGRKNHMVPGLYLHFGVEGIHLGGGSYMPDKPFLYRIRQAIMNDPVRVNAILNNALFHRVYAGEIKGEKNKILPKEFKDTAAEFPLLFNKQYYYMSHYQNPEDFVREDLVEFIMEHYQAGKPWNDFLNEVYPKN